MARVLILGASGYIGAHLAPLLAQRGHHVRAAARRVESLEARDWADVEICRADALDRESLDTALADIDVAYYLVHSMAAGAAFADLDRRAAATFSDAAAATGVRRVVYLGGIQPQDSASSHLASRLETGEVLRQGSTPVTELRAGIVVGPGSAAFEVIRDLVYHLPIMVAPRWVRSRSQPIALDDLLALLTGLLDLPDDGESHIYDAVGPETLSYGELMRQFGEVAGRPVRIIPLPVLTPRLSSYWLDLVTAVPARVARPLIDGLKHDLISDQPNALHELVPAPKLNYREAARRALEAEAADALPIRWTEGAFEYRRQRHDVSWFGKSEAVDLTTNASPDAVWRQISAIGGGRGWYFATWIWRLRGAIDRLLGGVGMRRGRRHTSDLRVGDPLDFWRVAGLEPGTRLTLVAEMKLPGSAVLELATEPANAGATMRLQAHFHPAGALGLLYWYLLWPIHKLIFRGLARAIVRRAESTNGQRRSRFASTSH